MKTPIFILLLIYGGIAWSQEYFPLVEENNEWNVLHVVYDGISLPWDTIYWTMSYKISGDTVIDNQAYKKVLKSEEEYPANWQYWGGMREEDQEVWYIGVNNYPESKIYDFDLSVGDTINFIFDFQPMAVDSVVYKEIYGEVRKHIYFSYPNMGYTRECWIEGIGSNRGILQSGTAGFVGGWTWMMCKSENGELIYLNPGFETCYMISTGVDENSAEYKLIVQPNPAREQCYLKSSWFNNDGLKIISMYNEMGVKVKEVRKINKTESISMATDGLLPGLYFIRVEMNRKTFSSKLIIK